ncbi:hypothetical protein FACS1894208_02110 [Clostridia bacterium]|nr:hypothetical protein FACS1894208_02110 [Clostridia bacterium]
MTEFKEALKGSGLARGVAHSALVSILDKLTRYRGVSDEKLLFGDGGVCIVYGASSLDVCWCCFKDKDADTRGVTLCVTSPYRELYAEVQTLATVYESPLAPPEQRSEHYSLSEVTLPVSDFHLLRVFGSGGSESFYASFSACVAVSKISGKFCLATHSHKGVVPLFWTATLADAWRICELTGLMPFAFKEKWDWKHHASVCSGVYSTREAFDAGTPDFTSWDTRWLETRKDLMRGLTTGAACVHGVQEIFDLALKQPVGKGVD